MVLRGTVKRENSSTKRARLNLDPTSNRFGKRSGPFVQSELKAILRPSDVRFAHDHVPLGSSHMLAAVFRHDPTLPPWTAYCDVHCAIIHRVHRMRSPPRARVRARKHTAHKDNNRQAVLAIVRDGVKVPPGITIGRDFEVKARSSVADCAARRPLSATMGTPAPGCALAPAR